MGQYFKVVNLTKKQYLTPWTFDDEAKLMEISCSSFGTMTALSLLLASGNGRGVGDFEPDHPLVGSWAGDKIVITGDYASINLHGVKAGKKTITYQYGKRKDETLSITPENQNIYSLISIDEDLHRGKNKDGRKWMDISKDVLKMMKKNDYINSVLKKRNP